MRTSLGSLAQLGKFFSDFPDESQLSPAPIYLIWFQNCADIKRVQEIRNEHRILWENFKRCVCMYIYIEREKVLRINKMKQSSHS